MYTICVLIFSEFSLIKIAVGEEHIMVCASLISNEYKISMNMDAIRTTIRKYSPNFFSSNSI